MSQQNVEMIIGRLVTDEGFRRRFTADAAGLLTTLVNEGLRLNPCEQWALAALDVDGVAQFAEKLHPSLQKVELRGDLL